MPQPKTQSSDLIDRLNEFAVSGECSPFAMQRLKADAKALQKSDAFGAFVVQGMIACLELDIEQMEYFHESALKLGPSDVSATYNFAQSLNKTGFYEKAERYYEIAARIEPADPTVLAARIDNLITAGHLAKASELIESFEKLLPSKIFGAKYFVRRALEILSETGIDDSFLVELQELAIGLLREQKIYPREIHYGIFKDGNSDLIVYDVPLAGTPGAIALHNVELAERIAQRDDDPHADILVFSYTVKPPAVANERKSA